MSNAEVIASLTGHRFVTVLTYERDWREIKSVYWFVVVRDSVCVWLRGDSGHVRRISQYPRARIAACDARGSEVADDAGTNARLEPWIPVELIEKAFEEKYGLLFWIARIGEDLVSRGNPARLRQFVELEPQIVDRDRLYDEEMAPRRTLSPL